ncbi:MAG: hypothetical protein SGI87_00155 [Flavobacteriales bacterium]|nr:hypothetical protein [Flavobacteriales bacterium]
MKEEANLSRFDTYVLFNPYRSDIVKKSGSASKQVNTLPYFAIAGISGSLKVVSDKGWLNLIPFCIDVVILSRICNWALQKWG